MILNFYLTVADIKGSVEFCPIDNTCCVSGRDLGAGWRVADTRILL